MSVLSYCRTALGDADRNEVRKVIRAVIEANGGMASLHMIASSLVVAGYTVRDLRKGYLEPQLESLGIVEHTAGAGRDELNNRRRQKGLKCIYDRYIYTAAA